MNLPKKTIQDIRNLIPCYDPSRYLNEDWEGTAIDVLKADKAPAEDRLWVVLNNDWISEKTMRLFAVWCAREALRLVKNLDPRSVEACSVAERYANGKATKEDLTSAWAAAWDAAGDAARTAARDAAGDAARAAAWAAAWDAAETAARAAAGDAARAAAWAAAGDAARAAAWAAARAAAGDAARAAAWAAAWDAAGAAQVNQLLKMLK